MKKLAALLLFLSACSVSAQSEADLLRWVQENKPLAESGAMSQLDFHREMHRRIAIIPASTYPHKVTNLRWIGRKVDILEAEAAGQLTREQAARKLAEEDAEMEAAEDSTRKARIRADFDRAEAARVQQEQSAAQAEAQRRALALQLLQNRMNQRPAYQPVTPYQIPVPRQTNCTSQWIGDTWQTVCR